MAFPIENFLSPNLTNQLITFVIPFLIIFGILLFALKRTHLLGYGNFIYILISLGITFMIYAINPNNVFQFLASYIFQAGVAGTVIALGGAIALIFIGIIRWGHETSKNLASPEQKLKALEKDETKLIKRYHSSGLTGPGLGERIKIKEQLDKLRKERSDLERYLQAKKRI